MNDLEKKIAKGGCELMASVVLFGGGLSGDKINDKSVIKTTETPIIDDATSLNKSTVMKIETDDSENVNVFLNLNPESNTKDNNGKENQFYLPTDVIDAQNKQKNIERNKNPTGSVPTEVTKIIEAEQRKIPCEVIYHGDTSKNEIAFTFDDTGANFDKILATLKEKGINGTFFLLASEIRNNPERWQQAVKDGNLICSHGTSHDFSLGSRSEEEIRADIQEWEDAVTEVLGADYLKKFKEETPYFRTPGGNKTETLLKVLGEMGYKYTFYWTTEDCWSMEPENNPDNLTMEQIYIFSAEPGAIFLLHPPHQSHLAQIIDGVEAKGYTFVTLNQWGLCYKNQKAS